MSKEIERKFLVEGDSWKKETAGVLYRHCTRLEFEYEIPYADAEKMLDELA